MRLVTYRKGTSRNVFCLGRSYGVAAPPAVTHA